MTANEKYDRIINLCKTLRTLEYELEKIITTKIKYSQSEGNKKVKIFIYYEEESVQYELDEKTSKSCMEVIENSYYSQKDDIIQTIKRELV